MESETRGRVIVEATLENLRDLWDAERDHLAVEQIRRVTVPDALVDTGATTLSLPTRVIQQLGLTRREEKRVTTSTGQTTTAALYDAVKLSIQGRQCTVDVMEVPDNVPTLIGQVPLELLDFVVDPHGQRLTGNPDHGGEHVFEMY